MGALPLNLAPVNTAGNERYPFSYQRTLVAVRVLTVPEVNKAVHHSTRFLRWRACSPLWPVGRPFDRPYHRQHYLVLQHGIYWYIHDTSSIILVCVRSFVRSFLSRPHSLTRRPFAGGTFCCPDPLRVIGTIPDSAELLYTTTAAAVLLLYYGRTPLRSLSVGVVSPNNDGSAASCQQPEG